MDYVPTVLKESSIGNLFVHLFYYSIFNTTFNFKNIQTFLLYFFITINVNYLIYNIMLHGLIIITPMLLQVFKN